VSPRHVLATSALAVGAACVLGVPGATAATQPAAARAARVERPHHHSGARLEVRGPSRWDTSAGQGSAAAGAVAAPLPGPVAGGTPLRGTGGAAGRAAAVPGSARGPPSP
jgi:hypothetical protein